MATSAILLSALLISSSILPPVTSTPISNIGGVSTVKIAPRAKPFVRSDGSLDIQEFKRYGRRVTEKYLRSNEIVEENRRRSLPSSSSSASTSDLSKRQGSNARVLFDMALAGQTGTVPLTDFFSSTDLGYVAPVSVGTPARDFMVLVDTGSSDLWLGAPGSAGLPSTFNPAKSSTFQNLSRTIDIKYNKGEFIGTVGSDVITFGGFTINNATISSGLSTDGAFADSIFDGLIGMASSLAAESKRATFMEQLVELNMVASPVFSMFLQRENDSQGNKISGSTGGGEMTLGGMDSSKLVGTPKFFPVLTDDRWTVQMDGFVVNGTLVPNTGAPAAIDSGTSLLNVPDPILSAIATAINGTIDPSSNILLVPCAQFPTMALRFGGQDFPLTSEDLIFSVVNAKTGGITGIFSDPTCIVSIQGGQTATNAGSTVPLNVLGDVFMKSIYSIFSLQKDQQNPHGSIGFAQLATASNRSTADVVKDRIIEANAASGATRLGSSGAVGVWNLVAGLLAVGFSMFAFA